MPDCDFDRFISWPFWSILGLLETIRAYAESRHSAFEVGLK